MIPEGRVREMPTNSFQPFLERDFAKVSAKPIIDVASPLLIEVVNHATQACRRCDVRAGQDAASGQSGEHLSPLMLYMHIIEMADGLEVLVSNSCSGPAVPFLRSMLEALLSLEYMFQEDYKRRSLCWLCSYIHKRIEGYELLDSTTNRGKELRKVLKKEGSYGSGGYSSSSIRARLQKVLASELATIEQEYKSQKKAQNRNPHWYSLFGGPKNLRDLAAKVSKVGYYDLLYRGWSSIMHVTDASRFLGKTSEGAPAFHQMRYPENLKDYTWLGVNFVVISTAMIIQRFRPGEDLSPWYNTEVKPRLDYLRKVPVKINSRIEQ